MASRVWLTRPQADSEAMAARLATHAVHSIQAPVMDIVPITPPPFTHIPHALLLTSRHAAPALAFLPEMFRSMPVYCVGSATAHAAHLQGFTNTVAGESDVLTLLPQLRAEMGNGNLLYLAGEDTRVDVAALLTPHGITVEKLVTYQAMLTTRLPDNLLNAFKIKAVIGACFFSPRSAQAANELLNQHGIAHQVTQLEAFCLSLPVAEAVAALPWKRIHACATPTISAMDDLIVSRVKTKVL